MNAVSYLDFYIEVTGQEAPIYQIAVRSRAGEARTATTFPYTNAELETELQRLENAILYAHTATRGRLPPQEAAVRDFGARFFEFLLPPGETRSLYYECRRLAEFEGKGVRLNLLIQPPQLAALPWEFLHDPRRRDYIALDPQTPLVRYPEIAQRATPLPVTPPLRILGLVANPTDLGRLDVVAEQRQVTTALQPLLDRGLVELTWLPGQGWRELQQWMRPGYGPWHIFHFIGHGSFDPQREEGRIFLADERGQAQAVSATQLSRLLAFQRGTLRLAILNACEGARGGKFDALSSTAATLVADGLPAVLAMQYAITDSAALEFARTFYSALSDNLPVDAAVAEARNAINLHNGASLEWGTPVLYLRTQDGQLFDLAKTATAQAVPSAKTPAIPTPSVRSAPPLQAKPSLWRKPGVWALALIFIITVLGVQLWPRIYGLLGIAVTPPVTPTPSTPDPTTALFAVNPAATNTALAVAPLVTATVSATLPPTPRPTATVNRQATETAEALLLATAAAATLTAQPTATPTSTNSQTPTHTPEPPTATPTATPMPTPVAGATRELSGYGLTFVFIPGGSFKMGSLEGQGSDSERPRHDVTVDAYWIGQTEVTNAQYRYFVEAGGYDEPKWWTAAGWQWREEKKRTEPGYWQDPKWNGAEQPVVGVSWYEAVAYTRWLANETGLTIRLPTEAEWERAARGDDGRIYPWGNEWVNGRANISGTEDGYYDYTAPVGSYPDGASPYGALDMAGNVWEWTATQWRDNYENYAKLVDNSTDGDGSARRVVRGGSWDFYQFSARAASRYRHFPVNRNYFLGFRVVVSVAPQ
ncbi:MAG: SUMF1/EgtB/PvdO family nonheme iron enzyme [Caldilineaceae bacterium]